MVNSQWSMLRVHTPPPQFIVLLLAPHTNAKYPWRITTTHCVHTRSPRLHLCLSLTRRTTTTPSFDRCRATSHRVSTPNLLFLLDWPSPSLTVSRSSMRTRTRASPGAIRPRSMRRRVRLRVRLRARRQMRFRPLLRARRQMRLRPQR